MKIVRIFIDEEFTQLLQFSPQLYFYTPFSINYKKSLEIKRWTKTCNFNKRKASKAYKSLKLFLIPYSHVF